MCNYTATLIEAEWRIYPQQRLKPDNGLQPDWCQAIISTNVGILSVGHMGTNFSEIFIGIQTFSLTKCIWKHCLEYGGHFVSASMRYLSKGDIARSHSLNEWWWWIMISINVFRIINGQRNCEGGTTTEIKRKVIRLTVVVFTGEVEACLQRLQWIPWLSP